jgi:hypothetical protein
VLVRDRHRVVPDERRLTGEQLVQHAAGGVHIGTGVDRLAARLLRGQVLGRADDRAGLGHRAGATGQCPRDAEVHHLDHAGLGEHHVARLDIAVDDAVPVAELEGRADISGDLQGPTRHQPALGGQHLLEGMAVDELHDDVRNRLAGRRGLLTGVVHGHDRGVVERCCVLRLPPEPDLERLVPGQVGAQHFDRDITTEPGVTAAVHLGHAAVAQHLADLVPGAE